LGAVSDRISQALRTPEVCDFFTRLIMRVAPKSYLQAEGEVKICAQFLDNFSGDQVRYLARSFGVTGDRDGQMTRGYRYPFGPVAIVAPFNFPLEIPVLQLMGALYMGNRPVLKCDTKVAVVMEQFLRLAHHCGLARADVDLLHCDGPVMNDFLLKAQPRMTLFTGSSRVAEKLAADLRGRIKLEDAGFDWKVLGPYHADNGQRSPQEQAQDLDYVSWVCDQDAYACSGQKCSAQSLLVAHKSWVERGLFGRLQQFAARRSLQDLTIGPVLTVTTQRMMDHVQQLLREVPGARLLFGGKPLQGGQHSIPQCYGALEPTAVYVPWTALTDPRLFPLVTTEIFGPVQVVTDYEHMAQLDEILAAFRRMDAQLTAAIVSEDQRFREHVLARTLNGTTYSGFLARTTGAPQNHWFGPAGDPRAAGIGTREAIRLVWSCHREIIDDIGRVPQGWEPVLS
jgi:1-pyrroline-5-carboxylate dehydrogenase